MSGAWFCPVHGRQTLTSNSSPPFCVMRTDHGYACGETLEHRTEGKQYPTDPRGQNDALPLQRQLGMEAPPPCCKRINHENAAPAVGVSWCAERDGHQGQCSPKRPPPVIELDDTGPGYTRRAP